jgi:hypothetical protein
MTALNTKANIKGPDEFYAELLSVHEGLSKGRATRSMRGWSCCWQTTSATGKCFRKH